jgi:hypothetical protein
MLLIPHFLRMLICRASRLRPPNSSNTLGKQASACDQSNRRPTPAARIITLAADEDLAASVAIVMKTLFVTEM